MSTIRKLDALAARLAFLGPLIARITVGVVFAQTGWGKLHNLPDVTKFFTDLGIPAPGFNAALVASTELVGGALVLVGLATRFAAGPLAFTMVIAILTAKRGDIDGLGTLLGFQEATYLAIFLWLVVAGAGRLSLDHLLRRRFLADAPSVASEPKVASAG
jgi:putative oxidoreductase